MDLNNLQLNKQKKILIVIFSLLIVYVDTGYILKAQLSGLKKLDPKIARLKADLKDLTRGLENMRLSQGKSGVPALKTSRSSRIIPQSKVSELLQEISNAANKCNITVVQLRPNRQTQKDKTTISQDRFSVLLINLDLIADYHNLGKFIQTLENSATFMAVQELEISTQLPDYMKQKVNLVLKTYVSK